MNKFLIILIVIILGLIVWRVAASNTSDLSEEQPPRNDTSLNLDEEGVLPGNSDGGGNGSNPYNP